MTKSHALGPYLVSLTLATQRSPPLGLIIIDLKQQILPDDTANWLALAVLHVVTQWLLTFANFRRPPWALELFNLDNVSLSPQLVAMCVCMIPP